ncbi:MAG: alpha/beta hydrolase [Cellulomonadaceae bacterium]|jgi:alpha-beta hydrolase superfamily lysophospholipase|nr:alpha/beta hydrolase [Cellulomonadaceae bacterium]
MWVPDFLPDFQQWTIPLQPDDEGDVIATLVRRDPTTRRTVYNRTHSPMRAAAFSHASQDEGFDVLYVHGWCDYFFQVHLADYWERQGATFYGLDLRKYGRSLRAYQTPGFIDSLKTYGEEIEAALTLIAAENSDNGTPPQRRRLVLMGHSMGGLLLSLWLNDNPGRADGLVLNSPWLEFQTGAVTRQALDGAVRLHATVKPRGHVVNPDRGFYSRSISTKYSGEWQINEAWRPFVTWQPTSAWLHAIFNAHDKVAKGLTISAPVLVLISTRSTVPVRWSDDMLCTDTVLDVAAIAQRVSHVGLTVTLAQIEGALHDVTLSRAEARAQVWREMDRWLKGYLPAVAPVSGPLTEPLRSRLWRWMRPQSR